MKQSRCPQYVGVACVDGTCPVANREEYEERGIPVTKRLPGLLLLRGL